jgi:hypothetical protein
VKGVGRKNAQTTTTRGVCGFRDKQTRRHRCNPSSRYKHAPDRNFFVANTQNTLPKLWQLRLVFDMLEADFIGDWGLALRLFASGE